MSFGVNTKLPARFSVEAAGLLDRYLLLLDSGRRPFETDWYRELRDAVEGLA